LLLTVNSNILTEKIATSLVFRREMSTCRI